MSNIEIHKTVDGKTEIDVKLTKETVWITQKQMCELFQTTKQNIFKEGELKRNSVVKEYLTTAFCILLGPGSALKRIHCAL